MLAKGVDMYFATAQTLIVIVLILAIVVLAMGFIWYYNTSGTSQDALSPFNSDTSSIRDIIINDSHLHRLLMIEIISDKPDYHLNPSIIHPSSLLTDKFLTDSNSVRHSEISKDARSTIPSSHTRRDYSNSTLSQPSSKYQLTSMRPNLNSSLDFNNSYITEQRLHSQGSEMVTFSKMSNGMSLFGKSLIRSFGVAISQRIATLMHKRNEILREYYWSMRNVVCHNGNCVHVIDITPPLTEKLSSVQDEFTDINENKSIVDDNSSHVKSNNLQLSDIKQSEIMESPISRTIIKPIFPQSPSIESLDITIITQRKLEAITREITDNIAASFHIRDVDQTSNKNRPIVHFQRLFNLITMYDKELINQAKSYASHHYDISMNCAQSASEITHHISDELIILMKESQQKSKIVSASLN